MNDEMKRVRSPNYPAISLKDAITHLNAFWPKMHSHAAPRDLVLKIMGYSSYNGASGSALSAHIKYGILEKNGENYKITALGQRILHPQSDKEKAEAIRSAALAPPLFTELLDNFGGMVPPSDEIIRSYLARRGFATSAIPSVIQSFRETMELLPRNPLDESNLSPPLDEEYNSTTIPLNNEAYPQNIIPFNSLTKPPSIIEDTGREFLHGPLSKTTSYRLFIEGEIGINEISKLIKILELQKEILNDDLDN